MSLFDRLVGQRLSFAGMVCLTLIQSCPYHVNTSYKYYYNLSHHFSVEGDVKVLFATDEAPNNVIALTSQSTTVLLYKKVLDEKPDNIEQLFGTFLTSIRITRNDTTYYDEHPLDMDNWTRTDSFMSPENGENAVTFTLYIDADFKPTRLW